MSQSLDINGKKYYPSSVLAERFEYSKDYVTRLAREKKIVAARVGRQWFVDAESLQDFVHHTEQQKQQRKEVLRKQRKAERFLYEQKQSSGTHCVSATGVVSGGEYFAIAQTCVVMLCGAFVGLLGFSIFEAELEVDDIALGVFEISNQFVAHMVPSGVAVSSFSTQASTYSSVQKNKSSENSREIHSELSDDQAFFADEIRVVRDAEGKKFVVPIFKDGKTGQLYEVTVDEVSNHHKP